MSQLPISNIISVSLATVQTGINAYNTSNLGLFTDEAPNLETFGSAGYALYLSPQQVGIDFGTMSKTYAMANAVFSQQPNIITGGGALIVILLLNAKQTLAFSGVAASGTFEITSTNGTTAAINWNDTASEIQTKVQAVTGQSEWLVTGSISSQSVVIQCAGTYGPVTLFTISANSLETSGSTSITVTPSTTQAGETIGAAITRTEGLVQYFGIMVDEDVTTIGQSDILAAAAIVQALNKIMFIVSDAVADIEAGGTFALVQSGSFTQTRCLYYNGGVTPDYIMMASYAGLALSVNFNGSNTTLTMNLKTLVGVDPDLSITQTYYNDANTVGADIYPSLQGVPCVISNGANEYYDQVYNAQWLVGALQVAGFNYLATVNTKIPQTQAGLDGLVGAYRTVLNQAVTNGYCAPGTWNSGTVFGNPNSLVQNVGQYGYYIYAQPIAQQAQTARVARQAPLVQIALKEAGAIQSSTVVVYVNP